MTESKLRDIRWIFALLAAYFMLQVGVRLATSHSLDLDEAEQAFRSQWLAAGYGPQPPFYNWLQYTVFQLTGVSLAALSVVKNLLLFIAYLLYGLTARLVLRDKALVAIATLGLLTIPQMAFEMQRDLTHTVAVFFSASIFIYGFIRSLKQPSLASYLISGIGIGFGLLAKYNFAILPAAALIVALSDARLRPRIFDRRLVLTATVALIITLPHLFWLKGNLDFATARTLEKMTASGHASYPAQVAMGISSLALAIISFAGLTVAVFAIVFGKGLRPALTAGSQWTRLFERMMLVFLVGILSLIVFGGAAGIKDRWLVPMLFILPLYFCLKIEAAGVVTDRAFRRFMAVIAIIMIGVPAALYGSVAAARFTGHYERLNRPYATMLETLRQQAEPAAILAGDSLLAGNLRQDIPGVPVLSVDYPGFHPDLSGRRPLLLVWLLPKNGSEALPPDMAEWLQANLGAPAPGALVIDAPYFYPRGDDRYRFGYAWVNQPG
ncbi:4-amino-4-deoxy-L-arabinose transferase-like glycosyltransferase [Rhizobium leguminosarum]|uniref:4-amino-4-deoxy-L-arabinose transferase-like glycosyltransferase n=1 Tax=Rhizobium leguminosarum TaxID=384 RepID=A0AAE2MH13_RHILE|nr:MULTISPECIES: glycosyltransferase family 39 protein [Rhizobium]MBB4289175.1 4-amino-4-deoxy-L-arabinose transferase-like glycosyltransferase [Rhizobium leguminosarum]MBB4294731.1 4-amino-4-deoxy-L-arabinose transferase-like glycosyltransferase [Rhizobium leguminosarum]MBB4306125.1 4-amino-4-deoxy-L-arabinose transferase-like glycosyltransferase [Rhizobium leguminosarum]MBB4418296.1 4-amino-4-deoxy-L-arabinose transferase-like glycosyltransferase [Rhizobium leguminosarum]MBB4433141.1 4-amino